MYDRNIVVTEILIDSFLPFKKKVAEITEKLITSLPIFEMSEN